MNVTELIAAVGGDENIGFQPLDQCATSLDWSIKSGARITFRSDVRITPEGTEKLGLVVWFPRDAVEAAIRKARIKSSRPLPAHEGETGKVK